jgi:cytoskeletal protein CcmA (bactofilin family)
MLQPPQSAPNSQKFSNAPNTYTPVKSVSAPMEQATIGRSLTIKGEISGSESLFIDGRIEGTINFADNRITIGRNGSVIANINAKEVVIMGAVKGNIQCTDRLDIRSEGSLIGDVVTQRISVEDGAVLKGAVEVRTSQQKSEKAQSSKSSEPAKPASIEQPKADQPKAAAAAAGSSVALVAGSQVIYKDAN